MNGGEVATSDTADTEESAQRAANTTVMSADRPPSHHPSAVPPGMSLARSRNARSRSRMSGAAGIPAYLNNIIVELCVEILRNEPDDVDEFCAEYFLRRQQRNSKSPAQRHPWDEERPWEFRESVAPSGGALTANALASARRRSISAESIIPSQLEHLIYKNIPKNEGQRERIRTTISTIFLFKSLEEKQINQIIDAMEEVRLPAGMKVLVEGDDADRYYVVESGTLEAWRSERDSDDRKVETYGPGTSFGELALMYQTKRAATVLVTSDCVLWVIDRQTFQQILSRRSMDTRRKYETFLEDVEILRNLTHYERTRLTEALETRHYRAGEIVIRQGEPGDLFFIIEHGTADISRVNRHGNVTQLAEIGIGKYFGGTSRGFEMIEPILERALLYGEPRSATVKAKTDLTVIVFSKDAFQRLLGPIHDVLKRFTFEPSPSIVSRYTLTKRSSKGGDESPVLAVGATALSRKRSSSQSPKPRSVHKK